MPDGGIIHLTTSSLRPGEAPRRDSGLRSAAPEGLTGLPAGDYCLLAVRDTGTGLGLSTAYGIVTQSGGHIFCSSQPGAGTTFTICLPAVEQGEEQDKPRPVSPVTGGTETILVVEDEDAVRELVRRMLVSAGSLLQKPFSPTELLRRVREVLDGR
jgi:hypothetical protein